MCRLYALRANEPTRVECGLVRSQNALMRQSQSDAEGDSQVEGRGNDGEQEARDRRNGGDVEYRGPRPAS